MTTTIPPLRSETLCIICLDPIAKSQKKYTHITDSETGHNFHLTCIDLWFQLNPEIPTNCPTCMGDIKQSYKRKKQSLCATDKVKRIFLHYNIPSTLILSTAIMSIFPSLGIKFRLIYVPIVIGYSAISAVILKSVDQMDQDEFEEFSQGFC